MQFLVAPDRDLHSYFGTKLGHRATLHHDARHTTPRLATPRGTEVDWHSAEAWQQDGSPLIDMDAGGGWMWQKRLVLLSPRGCQG